jgi:hypothetical protein
VANDFAEPPRGATKSDNEISNFQRESIQKCYIHPPKKAQHEGVGNTPRPEQTRKYEEHLDGNVKEKINTSHLISWSLQIARGMAFLASKKVTPL